MKTIDDGDIGACDDCFDTESKRTRTTLLGRFNDGPARYVAYLCPLCRKARKQAA